MKTPAPALLLALLLLLSGCATDPEAPAAEADPTPDAQATAPDATDETDVDAVHLTLDATVLVVQGDNVTLTGSVDRPAVVNVAYGDAAESFDADGDWSFTYTPPFGHDDVVVTADDGVATANATVQVQRNMLVTVAVDHSPASGLEDTTHTFYWDFGGLRSLHEDTSYEDCEQPHPGRPNAHDALLDFEDFSGKDIDFTPCGSFGVTLDAIDGDESSSFWCWQVNGETAEFGISLMELEDGDVFSFVDCYVAFPDGP